MNEREYTLKEKIYLSYRLLKMACIALATWGYILAGWWMLYLVFKQ